MSIKLPDQYPWVPDSTSDTDPSDGQRRSVQPNRVLSGLSIKKPLYSDSSIAGFGSSGAREDGIIPALHHMYTRLGTRVGGMMWNDENEPSFFVTSSTSYTVYNENLDGTGTGSDLDDIRFSGSCWRFLESGDYTGFQDWTSVGEIFFYVAGYGQNIALRVRGIPLDDPTDDKILVTQEWDTTAYQWEPTSITHTTLTRSYVEDSNNEPREFEFEVEAKSLDGDQGGLGQMHLLELPLLPEFRSVGVEEDKLGTFSTPDQTTLYSGGAPTITMDVTKAATDNYTYEDQTATDSGSLSVTEAANEIVEILEANSNEYTSLSVTSAGSRLIDFLIEGSASDTLTASVNQSEHTMVTQPKATASSSLSATRARAGGNDFVFEINTDAGATTGKTFQLPLVSSGTYNFHVEWGDGTNDLITAWDDATKSHEYSAEGIYEIRLSGVIDHWNFSEGSNQEAMVTNIKQWGSLKLAADASRAFQGCGNMEITATDVLDTSHVTSMYRMFHLCDSLTASDSTMGRWDVSNVTTFEDMFRAGSSFGDPLGSLTVSLDNWDTSSATNMAGMFMNQAYFVADMGSWDVSSVTDMSFMFHDGPFVSDTATNPITQWDVSSVEDMTFMFSGDDTSANVDLGSWDITGLTTPDSMENFLDDNLVVTSTYDNWLTGWSNLADANGAPKNVSLDAGTSTYTASTARDNLINNHGWSISDGGAA